MSGSIPRSLFFLGLPDLKSLVSVTLTVQGEEEEDEEARSKQIKTCRELVLLYADVLACPALDSFTDITVVLAIPFFQTGVLQAFGQRRSLQLRSAQCVFPGDLQCCLSYSLITRLSPSWNKAGLFLISGKDFLTESGRLNAVSMELSTSEGQLCISIEASTVRLPPTTLEDFDLPPLVLRTLCSDPEFVIHPSGAIWCHVLPSMKKGQIITISRQLPKEGPFRTYRDLQNHWNHMYGYRLPELAEEEVVYCSVYFRPVGERLFTYPLSCIRLQPVQRCPRVDLQGVLGCFLSDIKGRLHSVCGFPARLTSKPSYHTVSLNAAASLQALNGEQINLTTSFSIRPVLTQLPAPFLSQPVRPTFSSQPSAWSPYSQQDGPLWDNGGGFREDEARPSFYYSSSSSCPPFSVSNSSFCGSSPLLSSSSNSSSIPVFQAPSSFPSSSFSVPAYLPSSSTSSYSSSGFQPDSSIKPSSLPPFFQPPSSFSSISFSAAPPLPQPAPSKLVPIFRKKHPSHHINVALLRAQKEQLNGGGEEKGRVSLPAFGPRPPPCASPFPSLSAASLPVPPLNVPRFGRQPKPRSSTTSPPEALLNVNHISSLSPPSKPKAGLILKTKPELKLKTKSCCKPIMKVRSESSSDSKCSDGTNQTSAERPLKSSDVSKKENPKSSQKQVVFQLKPEKSRAATREADVEKMARSNQLSKLNSATLLLWLKERGVNVGAKHKKAELMLKVMSYLAES